jgi:hypothetical protein
MDDRPDMRAADADRQEVIERLRSALDEGRLKMDEYLERMGQASEAVTYGDLAPLYADLPEPGPVARREPAAPHHFPQAHSPLPHSPQAHVPAQPLGGTVARRGFAGLHLGTNRSGAGFARTHLAADPGKSTFHQVKGDNDGARLNY